MLKLISFTALACAAVVAAVSPPTASAAPLTNSVAVGRITVTRPGNSINSNIVTSNRVFTPNVAHGPKYKPAVRKWVCGPIVNYDGSPHCHWVTH